MKTVVILQSNYIPWKGYFDLMHDADEFVLYDDRQYTRQDWRNRNLVKATAGPQWLTIPVVGGLGQRIDEVAVADRRWAASHWSRLAQLYRRTPHFRAYADRVEAMYTAAGEEERLSRVNRIFLEGIRDLLGFSTPLTWSADYAIGDDGKTERLVRLCQLAGARKYISGPAAREYIQGELFEAAGIRLEFKDYSGYPEYPQPNPPFAHGVSVLDLLFCVGSKAPWYIWGWRQVPDESD